MLLSIIRNSIPQQNLIKMAKKWHLNLVRIKCFQGLANIWSNRGRWVSIIEICVPYTKMSISQHSRTTFKPNFTYIFLSVRAVSKNTVWVGWPCMTGKHISLTLRKLSLITWLLWMSRKINWIFLWQIETQQNPIIT